MTRIRHETPHDPQAIHRLIQAAFLDAPHTSHTEAFIVDHLRHTGALTLSLVAEHHGTLIGHLAASPVTISDGTTQWFGLGPIAVAPSHQNQGIGTNLMHTALSELQSRGAGGCVLLGDPRFYSRFGFKPRAGLTLPGLPAEFFFALAFQSPLPQGRVAYHPAFQATGPV